MTKYIVKTVDGKYTIKAHFWNVGEEGLKFFQDGIIVAWFTTWDYWMIEKEDDD